jgi:hypothetical protein
MKPEEICDPTPEQMTAALLKAAQARRWNHWQHEVETHAGDWVEAGAMRKPLASEVRPTTGGGGRVPVRRIVCVSVQRESSMGLLLQETPF